MYSCKLVTLPNGCKAWVIECLASSPSHWFAVVPLNSPYVASLPAIVKAAHKQVCGSLAMAKTG